MDYGLKVSKPGYDVNAATASQLAYSSKYSNFKIADVLTGILTVPAGVSGVFTTTITNPHAYAAMYMPFVRDKTTAPNYWQTATIGDASGTVFLTQSPFQMPNCYRKSDGNYECKIGLASANPWSTDLEFKIIVFADDTVGGAGVNFPSTEDYGIKVSQNNQSVLSGADTDMSMSSKFPSLTVFASGTVTDPVITINHNLGYAPIYMVLLQDPDTGKWRYLPTVSASGGVVHMWAYVDQNHLYLLPPGMYGVKPFVFKYVIFNERIQQ